jgi:hypothetical protein
MGVKLAEYAATGNKRALPFPIVPIRPLPLHPLHKAYVSAIIAWYRMTDGGVKQAA